MPRRSRTSQTVQNLRGVLGSYSPMSSYTGISAQRLRALAEGAKPTRSEAARIASYKRAVVEHRYTVREAAERAGVSTSDVVQRLLRVQEGERVAPYWRPAAAIREAERLFGGQSAAPSEERILSRLREEGVRSLTVDERGFLVGRARDGSEVLVYGIKNKKTGDITWYLSDPSYFEGYRSPYEYLMAYGIDEDEYEIDLWWDDWGED